MIVWHWPWMMGACVCVWLVKVEIKYRTKAYSCSFTRSRVWEWMCMYITNKIKERRRKSATTSLHATIQSRSKDNIDKEYHHWFMQCAYLSLWSQHANRTSMLFWQSFYEYSDVLDIQLARCYQTLDAFVRIIFLRETTRVFRTHVLFILSVLSIMSTHILTQLKVDNYALYMIIKKGKGGKEEEDEKQEEGFSFLSSQTIKIWRTKSIKDTPLITYNCHIGQQTRLMFSNAYECFNEIDVLVCNNLVTNNRSIQTFRFIVKLITYMSSISTWIVFFSLC